ncbi:MAG: hypothetical protein NXY57DRAFT_962724 [Lentinula lateritia]|uniref:GPI anchored protein n=1 Tax=Lentinula lateritia TaxID=40482 RepID=A0ABQ8VNN1_9AGAR|nr:MAG: hypothetical protein NXY57DRAFT_962724 [Lentinula lateritia]KAJ4498005.1 hypothetical protein C8R41DRAFT_865154 [Lentinula lateritia]
MHGSLILIGIAAGLQRVIAQSTSLYIPGFDPQPISANIVGVDSNGRTTWDLIPGSVTDDSEGGFIGTVTLVEGSDGAHLTYADASLSLTLGYDCTFSSGQAICSGVENDEGITFTETEAISSFAVALGTATAASASATGTGSSSSQVSGSESGSAAPTQTGSSNSSLKQVAASSVSLFGVVGLMLSFL